MTAARDDRETSGGAPSAEDEVLLLLHLRGPQTLGVLARASGVLEDAVDSAVERNLAAGLVERRSGERHALTARGGERVQTVLAMEQQALGALARAVDTPFAEIDRLVKQAVTDWQVVRRAGAQLPNDHGDAAYDARVLDRLAAAIGRALELVAPIAACRARVAVLCRGLERAVEHARRGERDYVAGLAVDSVHSLWWQLHGELLALLGRERAAG